jgi:hypothetical protein
MQYIHGRGVWVDRKVEDGGFWGDLETVTVLQGMMAPEQTFLVIISTSPLGNFGLVDSYKSCYESAIYNSCSKTMCVNDGTNLIVWSYFYFLRCMLSCLLINILNGPTSSSLKLYANFKYNQKYNELVSFLLMYNE